MIIGSRREDVIENIKKSAEVEDFYAKVEIDDPNLSEEECEKIAERNMSNRGKFAFEIKTFAARTVANIAGAFLNRDTEIIGIEKLSGINGGAIITSNHFSPLDNTVVRKLTRKLHKKRINIISQITNFAMTGPIGFLMNYADTIPLTDDYRYITHRLVPLLEKLVKNNEYVLIYPEREMWFNYRKPRPGLRGAYYFAAKLNVPLISCFIEMCDTDKKDTGDFMKVQYKLHILEVMYPDPEKSARQNSIEMLQRDYEAKKNAYEKVYGKPLVYKFENNDIAGWTKK